MADAIEELARVIAEIDTDLHQLRKAIDSPDDESGREHAIIERLSFRMCELTRLGEDIEHITKEAVAQASKVGKSAHDRMQAEKAHAVRQLKKVRETALKEAGDSNANLEYLRARLAALEIEVQSLTIERDEARREICDWVSDGKQDPKEVAKRYRWDCFNDQADSK